MEGCHFREIVSLKYVLSSKLPACIYDGIQIRHFNHFIFSEICQTTYLLHRAAYENTIDGMKATYKLCAD